MGQEIPYIVNREIIIKMYNNSISLLYHNSQHLYYNNYEKGVLKIAIMTKLPSRKGPESNLRN